MFSDEPSYTEVNPGADEVLDCQVENIGGECRWQKDGKVSSVRVPFQIWRLLESSHCGS